MEQTEARSWAARAWAKPWTRIAIMAAAGAIAGYALGRFMAQTDALAPYDPVIRGWFDRQGWTGFTAAAAMLLMAILAATFLIASLRNDWLAVIVRADADEDLTPMLTVYRVTALALACDAALILLFLIDALSAAAGVTAAAALTLVNGWAHWRALQESDELWRRVTLESWALYGIALGLILSMWAAAAHFGVMAAIVPLPLVLTIQITGVVTSVIVVTRYGLAESR